MEIKFNTDNQKLIELVQEISPEHLDSTLETYILLGHTVIGQISIGLKKEVTDKLEANKEELKGTITTLMDDKTTFLDEKLTKGITELVTKQFADTNEKFKVGMDETKKYVESTVNKTIAELNEQSIIPLQTVLKLTLTELSTLTHKIKVSPERGAIGVEFVFDSLCRHFRDGNKFEITQGQGHTGDIISHLKNYTKPILIEVKKWDSTVTTKEVEKFWNDMDSRNCKYGMFVSIDSDISKIHNPIQLENNQGKIGIFVTNHKLMDIGHLVGLDIIKMIIELEVVHHKEVTDTNINAVAGIINKNINKIKEDIQGIELIYQHITDARRKNDKMYETTLKMVDNFRDLITKRIDTFMKELGSSLPNIFTNEPPQSSNSIDVIDDEDLMCESEDISEKEDVVKRRKPSTGIFRKQRR
ncbi:MAG: restriction endonuclease [Candidatus Methanoperedens sp.]|nr:restriction endonuclease [Candidatus Methanoperedens sp.]